MLLSPTVVLVLVVVGLVYVFYTFTSGRAKHGKAITQADEDIAEQREDADDLQDELAVIESEITNQGFIQLTCGRSEATALFDPVNEVVHLKCDDLGSRTEGCPSQEHAEILFLEFVIEELELLKD